MFPGFISIFLRSAFVITFWVVVWKFVEPKTQQMKVFRAALLLLGSLVALAALRMAG